MLRENRLKTRGVVSIPTNEKDYFLLNEENGFENEMATVSMLGEPSSGTFT
jgi:hypothetical protein